MPLLNSMCARTQNVSTRATTMPTRGTSIEQCAVSTILHLRYRPATHFALRARYGGSLENDSAMPRSLPKYACALARSGTSCRRQRHNRLHGVVTTSRMDQGSTVGSVKCR